MAAVAVGVIRLRGGRMPEGRVSGVDCQREEKKFEKKRVRGLHLEGGCVLYGK